MSGLIYQGKQSTTKLNVNAHVFYLAKRESKHGCREPRHVTLVHKSAHASGARLTVHGRPAYMRTVCFPLFPAKTRILSPDVKKEGGKGERPSNGYDNRAPSPDSRLQEMC